MKTYRPFILRIDPVRDDAYPVSAEFEGQVRQGRIPIDLPLLDTDEIRQAQTWLEPTGWHDMQALAEVLAGASPARGRLPVTLPGLYEVGHWLARPGD